jgi:hypothetical protein
VEQGAEGGVDPGPLGQEPGRPADHGEPRGHGQQDPGARRQDPAGHGQAEDGRADQQVSPA